MKNKSLLLLFVFVGSILNLCYCDEKKGEKVMIVTAQNSSEIARAIRDSYLQAYSNSRERTSSPTVTISTKSQNSEAKIANRDSNIATGPSGGDDYFPRPQTDYGPPIYSSQKEYNGPYAPSPTSVLPITKPISNYGLPQSSYTAPQQSSYTAPQQSYGVPQPIYGPPQGSYGPPAPIHGPPLSHLAYGPPTSMYGPPMGEHAPVYGPPPPMTSGFEMPHAMTSFFDKFKLKLDIFTILKILLKLIIFKKIVKFFAILCLLLFIPYFKPKENNDDEDDEGMMRKWKNDDKLNSLTQIVIESFEKYTNYNEEMEQSRQEDKCETSFCRIMQIFNNIDQIHPNNRLNQLYDEAMKQ